MFNVLLWQIIDENVPVDVVEEQHVSEVKWKQNEKIWFMFNGSLCGGHVIELGKVNFSAKKLCRAIYGSFP